MRCTTILATLLAAPLAAVIACTPGTYSCTTYPAPDGHHDVLICDAEGNWQIAAQCKPGQKCEMGFDSGYCL